MKIIIVGAGTVGAAICQQLANEGHDITMVDKENSALYDISDKNDVFAVDGNGADVAVLEKAGADRADLLIAVTSSDELNILCCAAARKLGTHHTIARVRNPEYSGLVKLMKDEMEISLTINPEYAVAKEISRILRFPSAMKIDSFCRGRVELAEIEVDALSPLLGSTLYELRNKLNIRFLVCAVVRNGEAHIPKGYFKLEEGDVLCVTAPEDEITKFFKAIGAYKHPVRHVLIVGGGRITYYLEGLLKKAKIDSTVIEKDKELCRSLAEDFDCTVICGDGTDRDLLTEEGLEKTDAFLSLSDEDEENVILSMFAESKSSGKVVTLIRAMSYIDLFRSIGLESIVSPKSATMSYILRYVRSMNNTRGADIESVHKLMEDKAEALEFLVKENIDGITEIPLKELKLRSGLLIACIVHQDQIIIPSGDDLISRGDTVIVVTAQAQIKGIKDILK